MRFPIRWRTSWRSLAKSALDGFWG
ncbi:hypothetical protein ACTIVE_8945 [Actinomadura verrucosospora]|uniref:Uncharacterized protein n=1 Tax=Actinomadura verrucosospora TaxID=46165 RepID=A0A7D3W0C8_ACTVE|nr:hypothetical protein ACTIVE_8945 [Actinomadura verrucosospora]